MRIILESEYLSSREIEILDNPKDASLHRNNLLHFEINDRSGKVIILKLVLYFARKIVIFDIPHPYVTEFPIIEHMNMSFQAVDKQ